MRKSEGSLPSVAALLVFATAACSGSVRTTDDSGEGDGDRNEPGADVPVPDDPDQDEPGTVTPPGRPGSGIGGSSGNVLNAEVSHDCYSESAFSKVVDLADDAPNGWTSLVPVDGPYIRAHYFVEPSGIYVAMREPFRLIRFPETGGTYETVFTHEYPVAHPLVLDDGVLFFSHALEQEAGADGFGGPSRFFDATSGA